MDSSTSTSSPDSSGLDLAAAADKTQSAFCLTALQVAERFDRLPPEQRKTVAVWASQCSHDLLVLPKNNSDQAAARPERWRLHCIDTQRFCAFAWKRIVWIASSGMVKNKHTKKKRFS